ncbi:MAG TPA: TIGR03619 family F420-dependent LLM class oxidoreductase [Microthrixaceae bacterium]|nr:TIGR03619 family F420-dependent LLM class oxidoreductase [Microthrixaceae bacterium]
MAAIIEPGRLEWGIQLPIQSQSTIYVQEWEASAGPDELGRVAKACDEAGAFYVGVCDHIAIPQPHDEKMGGTWYDTIATLSWLAAQTSRTHLLSHVAVLPYRHPLMTAKAWNTLDRLSGGRAVLGVGAGHVEAEFDLLGLDFDRRGPDLDRSIAEVRRAFEQEVVDGAVSSPRPVRAGGPPIWVGGSSMPAMRRAARLGDGWLPQGPPKMGMRGAIEFIVNERSEHFGDDVAIDLGSFTEPIHVGTPDWEVGPHTASGTPDEIAERLRRYRKLGVSHLQPRFPSRSCDELVEQLLRFGAEVWPLVVA